MLWVVVDVLVVVLSLGALALTGLALWRRLKELGTQAGVAGERLAAISAQLEQISAADRAPGVRSTLSSKEAR